MTTAPDGSSRETVNVEEAAVEVAAGRGTAARFGLSMVSIGTPIAIALLVGGIVLWITGQNPFQIYGLLAREAFGGISQIDATLAAATPLMFTAVAAAVAFRAGVFTIGVEGSFVFGGLTAAVVGAHVGGLPTWIAIPVCLLAAAAAGLLVALVPAILRVRWGVDEVVSTLMLNFIVVGVTSWLLQSFFQAPGQANSATAYVADAATLPPLNPPNQANYGLVIALVLLVGYALWIRRSVLGYEFRIVGTNQKFAAAQGLRVRTVILLALLIAGVIGGIGGGAHTLGLVHRFTEGFSANFGFTGIAIALLARFKPFGLFIGAVFFGALSSAGTSIQLFVNIPIQLVDILQGTVMLLATAQFSMLWIQRIRTRRRTAADPDRQQVTV